MLIDMRGIQIQRKFAANFINTAASTSTATSPQTFEKTTVIRKKPNLDNMPPEILGMIASYMKPREVLDTLALVSKNVFNCLTVSRSVPWNVLELGGCRDSLIAGKLTCLESLRKITICNTAAHQSIANYYYANWASLVRHPNLRYLNVESASRFFAHVDFVTPFLETLILGCPFYFDYNDTAVFNAIKNLRLPNLKNVRFGSTEEDLIENCQDARNLFRIFPNVRNVMLYNFKNVPQSFWDSIPHSIKEKNETLTLRECPIDVIGLSSWNQTKVFDFRNSKIKWESLSFAPKTLRLYQVEVTSVENEYNLLQALQYREPNITCLSLCGPHFERWSQIITALARFRNLEFFAFRIRCRPDIYCFRTIFSMLPNLKYLLCKFVTRPIYSFHSNDGFANAASEILHRPMISPVTSNRALENQPAITFHYKTLIIASPEIAYSTDVHFELKEFYSTHGCAFPTC